MSIMTKKCEYSRYESKKMRGVGLVDQRGVNILGELRKWHDNAL